MADKTQKKPSFFARIVGFFKGIGKFFRDTFSEMKKVAWPSKKQIINNSLIVLVVVVIAALVIFALDAVFGFVLQLLVTGA